MQYGLKRPCKNCPFRCDMSYLRRARALEIAESLANGATFPCHETTVEAWDDDDGEDTLVAGEKSHFCAGALLIMEKMEQPNQVVRIAERLGQYDPAQMDTEAPVYRSLFAFVEGHEPSLPEWETCCVVNAGCEAPAGALYGSIPLPVEPDGEVHECPTCGEPVCEACSNDEGVCANCTGEDDDG